jgi:hypothetical protein
MYATNIIKLLKSVTNLYIREEYYNFKLYIYYNGDTI